MPRARTRTRQTGAEATGAVGEAHVSVTSGPKEDPVVDELVVEHPRVPLRSPHPAYVKVGAGITKSLGPGTYEFCRIDVSVEMPCDPDLSEGGAVDQTYDACAARVDELMSDELERQGFDSNSDEA